MRRWSQAAVLLVVLPILGEAQPDSSCGTRSCVPTKRSRYRR